MLVFIYMPGFVDVRKKATDLGVCFRYGSWRPLDVIKTLSEDVRTFSTIGQLILRTSHFRQFPHPQWARAQVGPGPKWARAQVASAQVGPGRKWAQGLRAQVGPGPKWARAQVGQSSVFTT